MKLRLPNGFRLSLNNVQNGPFYRGTNWTLPSICSIVNEDIYYKLYMIYYWDLRIRSIALGVREVCQAFISEVLSGSLEENQLRYSTRILRILNYLDRELYERF